MKVHYFFISIMLCLTINVNNTEAQITVVSTDYASIGDSIIRGVDTLPSSGILVGSTGNQTWDFTSLQIHTLDSIVFVDPGTTTSGTDFPNSNLAYGIEPVYYQSSSASSISVVGYAGLDPFGGGLQISAVNDPTHNLIEFPSTNGNSFTDTSEYSVTISTVPLGLPIPNLDSFRVNHSSYINSLIDAYGLVATPTGTYNSLRQTYTELTIDSMFAYCSDPAGCNAFIVILPFGWSLFPSILSQMILGIDNPDIDTTFLYKWWANGEDLPVAELETETPGGVVISANFIKGVPATALVIDLTDVLCAGDCNGTAEVVGVDGNSPYFYLWDDSNVQTTSVGVSLCMGTYNVRVINSLQDTTTVTFSIGSPQDLSGVVTTTPDSGAADGTAGIMVSGGTSPYTYAWSDPSLQTQATATGLSAGNYFVTITDTNSCFYVDSALISSVSCSVSSSFSISDSTVCVGATIVCTNTSSGAIIYEWLLDGNSFSNSTDASYTFTSAGVFIINLVASEGICSDSVEQTVTVNSNPPTPTVSVLGNTVSCDIVGSTYQWFFNGDTIAGETGQFHIATQDGFYSVTVFDINGCSATSDAFGFTGIEDVVSFNRIKIYPNPNSGQFTLEMNFHNNTGIFIDLYNFTGQLIYTEEIGEVSGDYVQQIDISNYAKGVYYVQVVTDGSVIIKKVLYQ